MSTQSNHIGYEQDDIDNSDSSGEEIKPSAEAEGLFQRGLKLFKQDGKYEEAYKTFMKQQFGKEAMQKNDFIFEEYFP